MFELLIKQCKLQRKALYLSLALVAGMFAFGTILHEIILYVDADPETTVFHLGTLIAVVGLMATAFFYESQEMYMSANFALGMGAVRKQFYPMTLLTAVRLRMPENTAFPSTEREISTVPYIRTLW